MASSRTVMGEFTIPPAMKWIGWSTVATMVTAAAGVFAEL